MNTRPDFEREKRSTILLLIVRIVIFAAIIVMSLIMAFTIDGLQWLCLLSVVMSFLLGLIFETTLGILEDIEEYEAYDHLAEMPNITKEELMKLIEEEFNESEDEEDDNE